MYTYRSRKVASAGAIFFIVFFILVLIGTVGLFYLDKGRFWDLLIYICIPSAVINLILLIFYFIRRSGSRYVFILFFLAFLTGIVLSSLFGPFRLYRDAMESYENDQYSTSINNFEIILDQYPNSKYARDSEKNIAYASFLNGDYEDAIKYFNQAIKDEIINGEDFEIKKIFAQSYSEIGENYYKQKDYKNAARNYFDAVQYYEEIEKKFPDTNDAFISKYKIPEFLFKASDSLAKIDIWDQAAANLSVIISSYPESDYFKKANDLLFNLYISKSSAFKKNGQYRESLLEFLKVFTFPEDILKEKKYQVDYQFNSILRNIPNDILIQTADEIYRQSQYSTALLIFEYIFTNFPENQKDILENFIDSKAEVVADRSHVPLPEIKSAGTFVKEGLTRINLENKTEFTMMFYISGPQYNIFNLETGTRLDIEITSGSYVIFAELLNSAMDPFYGKIILEEGVRYRQTYSLAQEEKP